MSGPTVEELLQRNKQRAQQHVPIPSLSEMAQLPPEQQQPMPKIFLVSCCDNRLDPMEALGLSRWDAVSARSAAGRMKPQMQNLIWLDHVLHFNDVMIIHHTDCSAELFQTEDVRQSLKDRAPEEKDGIDQLELPGFTSLEQSVRDDVQLVKRSPLIRKELADRTRGFIYDIKTGRLNPVA